jgi:TonB family protein
MRLPQAWIRAAVLTALTGAVGAWDADTLVAQESPACQEVRTTTGAPSITTLVDPLALNSEPHELLLLGLRAPDSALVALHYDSAGALAPAQVSHPTATYAQAARIREWLQRHSVPSGERGSFVWGVLLWGEGVTLRPLEVLTRCDPKLRNEERERLTRALNARPQTHGVRVVLWLLVGADGSVREVEIAESSGSMPADAAFQEVVRPVIFEPARINGDPIPVWIRLPIQYVVRRRR